MPLLIGSTAVVTIALALGLYRIRSGRIRWSPTVILGVALFLRLCFVFSPPQLSDDLYRYLWDGSQLLHGTNPYTLAPAAAVPADAAAEALRQQVNHPELVTIYPPAAQLVFAAGLLLGGTATGMKFCLVALDLLTCVVILRLLARLSLPGELAILYAWNPLPVLEIAGSGHVDGVGALLLLGACLLLGPGPNGERPSGFPLLRPALSGALLAAAGLIKLFPLVLLPGFLCVVPARQRRLFLAGFLATGGLLLLPFLPELGHLGATLGLYAQHWEFAGFAFNLLRSASHSGLIARGVLILSFAAAIILLALRLCAGLHDATVARRERLLLRFCFSAALAFALLTPTLHPWYALMLAAFLPFCAGPASLVLCWSVFLGYRVLIPYAILGQWQEDLLVTAMVFSAPAGAAILGVLFRSRMKLASPAD